MPEPARFYADAHIHAAVTPALRTRGIDITRTFEAGLADAGDLTHLEFAREQGRVLIIKDRDFVHYHKAGTPHAGIAFFQQDAGVGYLIGQLLFLHAVMTGDEMIGRLEFL